MKPTGTERTVRVAAVPRAVNELGKHVSKADLLEALFDACFVVKNSGHVDLEPTLERMLGLIQLRRRVSQRSIIGKRVAARIRNLAPVPADGAKEGGDG